MFHYRYIGADDFLTGETALGQEIDGVFKVQVNRIEHPWAHGWHETPCEQWVRNLQLQPTERADDE